MNFPQLEPKDQGFLVVVALNHLWSMTEDEDLKGCCPRCCGTCDLIQRLLAEDKLEAICKLAEPHHWGESIFYWKDGQVDREWLAGAWHCVASPPCEPDEFDDPSYHGETITCATCLAIKASGKADPR